VFTAIPDSDGVQQLLNQLVEEDADRRVYGAAVHYGSAAEDESSRWWA